MDKIFDNLETELQESIEYLKEKRNLSLSNDMNDFFFLSKDVARILLADVYMYRGKYSQAEELLAKVIENRFYSIDGSNYSKRETIDDLVNNRDGKETIFAVFNNKGSRSNITISEAPLIPIMTYTDVILSYAECLYKNGKDSAAKTQLNEVTSAKNINVTEENVLDAIKDIRMGLMLYGVSNFAFMKRNDYAESVYGIEPFRKLLPIPQNEMDFNMNMKQNPGY